MVTENERSARESSVASGWTVEGRDPVAEPRADPGVAGDPLEPSEGNSEQIAEVSEAAPQLSSIALVILGLVGGLYLFYTVVWFSWANHYSTVNALVAAGSGSIGGVLQQVVFWVTPFAPALWFVTVLVLCRGSKPAKVAIWLAVGAIVLVPLPMFEGVLF